MKMHRLIHLVAGEGLSIYPGVPSLPTLAARAIRPFVFGRLDDIRRGWFRRVRRVLGKLGHLFAQLGHLGEKLGVLLLECCDSSQIELFRGRFHRPFPAWLGLCSFIGRNRLRGKENKPRPPLTW